MQRSTRPGSSPDAESSRHTPGHLALLLAAAVGLASLTACDGPGTDLPPGPATTAPAVDDVARTTAGRPGVPGVGVQLFQWTWDAIAAECTDHLGPDGYGWVLTSPPQEHVLGAQWWTSYQPVSYRVESRLGTRAQFAAMVDACHAAGVDVVADAVLNHMTGQDVPGTGWAGSAYEHLDYPGIYSDTGGDFHHCGLTPGDDIADYDDPTQVRRCELVNLADLATETPHVRATLAAYLQDLRSLGVDGFRIDAAKHVAPDDIGAVLAELPADTVVVQEVIRGAGEPITPEQFVAHGQVLEFGWAQDLRGLLRGSLSLVEDLGPDWGYVASADAVIFVDNHDTERNGSTLSYRDGWEYTLGNVLLLASAYGTPVVYSGYAFSDRDAGPPQDTAGAVLDAVCPDDAGPDAPRADGEWTCQHRWDVVTGMVGWRAAVTAGEGAAPTEAFWSEGEVVAFSRGARGLVVVNAEDTPLAAEVPTTMPDGDYCDVTAGPVDRVGAGGAGECPGETVEVRSGVATVAVASRSALAVHIGAPAG